ncbi:MAG: hypothetical protein IPH57_18650 [Saprospiraceae bacterium]|nr:hypothetical protein [Saprospiraceae bacterium]
MKLIWINVFIILIFLIVRVPGFTQSREVKSRVDTEDPDVCCTCNVSDHCQPHPLAGTSGHDDFGYMVEEIWGPRRELEIQGKTFYIFNATDIQIQIITEAIEILPVEYINMLPHNFRVGNPNRPYGITSAGRVIGGSKFCMPYREENIMYESIVFHEGVFTTENKKHRTVLHECGHFFVRKFSVVERMNPEQIALSAEYLANDYEGATTSHSETVAQSFMYFFHQMYFDGNTRRAVPKTVDEIVHQPARGYKRWMHSFVKPVILETSSL